MTGADTGEDTAATKPPNNGDKPPAYWVVKVTLGLAIAGLAGAELFSTAAVSPIVYALLAALAGGPEITEFLRRGPQ